MARHNKVIKFTRKAIPYLPQLRSAAGSVTATVLMQQLEFWFADHPDGFYKFLSPCPNNEKYRAGDSWTEELAFSLDEFRGAFDSIGVRYKSKKEYSSKTPDFFQGKYYCSYFDKIKGLTYYFRNHELVDGLLDSLIYGDEARPSREVGNPNPRELEESIHVNRESQSLGMGKVNPESISSENTSKITPNKRAGDFELENSPSLEESGIPNQSSLTEQPCQPSDSTNDKAYPEDKNSVPACDNTTVDVRGGAYRMEQRFRKVPKLPAYRTGSGANGIKAEFIEYLCSVYLPKTPHYRENGVDMADAKTWITKREDNGQQDLVEARYEQMLTDATPKPSRIPQVSYEPLPEKKCWLPPVEEREAFKKQLRAKKAGLK